MQAEKIAQTFYETMFPGLKWADLRPGDTKKAVMLVASTKVLVLFESNGGVDQTDLFGLPMVIDDWPKDYREQFWARYPHKVGKKSALAKLDAIHDMPAKKRPKFEDVMMGLDRYVDTKPVDRSWCNPETFLSQHRWLDEPDHVGHNGAKTRSRNGLAALVLDDLGR
jgi:hypothetical protein